MVRHKTRARRIPRADEGVETHEQEDAISLSSDSDESPASKRRKLDNGRSTTGMLGLEIADAGLEGLVLRLSTLEAPQLPAEEVHVIQKLPTEGVEQDPVFGDILKLVPDLEGSVSDGLHLAFGIVPFYTPENQGRAAILQTSGGETRVLGYLMLPCQATFDALVCLFKAKLATLLLSQAGSSSGGSEILFAVSDASLLGPDEDHTIAKLSKADHHWLELLDWLIPSSGPFSLFPAERPAPNALDGGPASPRSQAAAHHYQHGRDAAAIYAAVRPSGREQELRGDFPKLKVQLRPYQRRAVNWMVTRERGPPQASKHPLWRQFPLYDQNGCITDGTLHYNPFSGRFSAEPVAPPEPVRGGILADEMGLGKTVEVLACIMAHPFEGPRLSPVEEIRGSGRPVAERVDCVCGADSEGKFSGLWVQCEACLAWCHAKCVGQPRKAAKGKFVCGPCQSVRASAEVTEECGATLIVCPRPIFEQWQQEIAKHIQPGALKVTVYNGQSTEDVVTAAELASADIVLTTYDVLAHDIYRVPPTNGRTYTLRHKRKYEFVATPLTQLTWWRICMDEAQMIESGAAAAARLAAQLKAVHRWAITGTPINSGLHDLFGLMSFLKAAPFSNKIYWARAYQAPFEDGDKAGWARVIAALRPELGGLLWRSSKADVAGELDLPSQERTFTSLEFAAMEKFHYNKVHENCAERARSVLDAKLLEAVQGNRHTDEEDAQRRLSAKEQRQLLMPLLRLRQACCHPQIGGGAIKQLQARKNPLTMDEMLEVLIAKAKNEAEEALRLLLFALNGLGGLLLLKKEVVQAIQSYREGLRVAEVNKAQIKADSLQQLHAMHNLAPLLTQRPEGVPATLRDSSLQAEAEEIRQRYMAQWWAKLAAAEKDYKAAAAAVEKASSLPGGAVDPGLAEGGSWFLEAVEFIEANTSDEGDKAIVRIKEQLADLNSEGTRLTRNATSLAKRLEGPASLKLILHSELSAMEAARQTALLELERLGATSRELAADVVEQAGQCGRCRADLGKAGSVCLHCRLDDLLMAWELRLFSLQAHAVNKQDSVTAENALLQAQQAALTRVGRGGLGEDAAVAEAEAGPSEARRGQATGVAYADVVHAPSEAEQLLKLLLGQLRNIRKVQAGDEGVRVKIMAAGKCQLDRLESMRKFFVKSRALSTAQRELLYAKDELEMCTMRIRLRANGERVKQSEAHFKIHPAEVPVKIQELEGDRVTSEADLSNSLGTLRFLHGLRQKGEEAGPSGVSRAFESDCPVCHEPLAKELMMLPCGHSLCYSCSLALTKRTPYSPQGSERISCPSCRKLAPAADIAYVQAAREEEPDARKRKQAGEEESIHIKGSFGTKMEAVVRRIKWLTRRDSNVKMLVFSSWNEVLDVLSHALRANDVKFVHAKTAKDLGAAIQQLKLTGKSKKAATKSEDRPLQTLLLPLKQGANGLNLTEAQHVILVEPVLDPAVEAQAVGRVHRIGQKKKTYVHNFVVKESIEQNVYKLNRERAETVDVAAIAANRPGAVQNDQQFTIRDVALLLEKPWCDSGNPLAASGSSIDGL